ncbi:hypothetical protein SAMN04488074_105135 [Lentzea albidocapillata subsp. violacea]|uniref:Uncharacterized protein n=1 Tax=Lentzea albidocapillata subsp. violacea TaxID=128104 RepID=A0A1G9AVN4_9PSEU|nr:hypothetical protein [Lentzea albidocapillata]SDK31469.1 hypothetical protein SAMN04488074_105135 [Lentzea albidocapillata subsp. violacea]
MIAVTRPGVGTVSAAAVLRAVLLFLLDVLECLGSILQPAFWSAVALAVAWLVGMELGAREADPTFGGFVAGALAMCIVLCLLIWADRRHRWWAP